MGTRIKLFKYTYIHLVKGSIEAQDIAITKLAVPENASFETIKKMLLKKLYRDYFHEIICDSIVDLGVEIKLPTWEKE